MRITTFYHTEKIWGQKYDKIEILNYLTSQSDKIQNFGNDLFSCYIGNKTNYNQSFSYKR